MCMLVLAGCTMAPPPISRTIAGPDAEAGVNQHEMSLFDAGGPCVAYPPSHATELLAATCTPGPQATTCVPTANAIPVPIPQGETVYPSNAGCIATTYSPDFYFQFEPGATTADTSGHGRNLIGFNGNGFSTITSDANGGYLASSLGVNEYFSITNPDAAGATHGGTLELLLRFGPNGAVGVPDPPRYGVSYILGLGPATPSSSNSALRLSLYNYAAPNIQVEIGLIDASIDGGSTATGTATFNFYMTGFNGRAWTTLLDGQFHHFGIVVDLVHAQISLAIDGKVQDGWTQPLPTASALTGLNHHLSLEPVEAGVFSWAFNGEAFRGDLDEVAWTPSALPLTLLAQHAQGASAQTHYKFTDQCLAPPPVLPSTDARVVATDFAPTVDGTEPPTDPWLPYLDGGKTTFVTSVPSQLASEQLLSFPLPRYARGNTVPRMDHWLDPTYFAWLPEFEGKRALADQEREGVLTELTRHWNFHSYINDASSAADWAVVASEGAHSLSFHTFLVNSDVNAFLTSGGTYSGQFTRAAAAAFRQAGAAKGKTLSDNFASRNPTPFVVDDALIVEDGESITLPNCTYAWLSGGSPDFAAFHSGYDSGGACAANSNSATCAAELAQYQADTINLLRQAYYDGIASALPRAYFPNVRFSWYWLDGYAAYQRSVWSLGGRDAAEVQPGQLFESPGFKQRLSTSDEYWRNPTSWDTLNAHADCDLTWLDVAREPEEAAGDYLTSPFVSGGWSQNPAEDTRPPQMLSLEKFLLAAGAISFHPGVFATARIDDGVNHPTDPSDAREYIWQAAAASYGQALASKVESRMRSSKIVWETDEMGGHHIYHQAGDPSNLVGVRQQFDEADAPLQRYLISTGLEGFANGVGGQWRRSGDVTFALNSGGPTVTLPARRQGSFYSLDLDGASPVLIQYDAWHEDGAFNYWKQGFSFEAEGQDAVQDGSGGAHLVAATEAPGIGELDFRDFTSFLTAQPSSAQSWSFAQAPRAGYLFEPRSAWGTSTWYVWVRARNHGANAAPVYVSLDEQPPVELGCIYGSDWQWVQTDVLTGQAAALIGVSMDVTHTLWVAPGSGTLDIDQVKLVAEADHMECPLAATCGCGAAGIDGGPDAGEPDAGSVDAGQDAGEPDAGSVDAGQDAGEPDAGAVGAGQDAGAGDAGSVDAGNDGGQPILDGGAVADGGAPVGVASGCGCNSTQDKGAAIAPAAMLLAGLALIRRRRRASNG